MPTMLLHEVVRTSDQISATRSRSAKIALVAGALRAAGAPDGEVVACFLAGELRQRRTGVGWRSLAQLPAAASAPSLTVAQVDAALDAISVLAGTGSAGRRAAAVADLFARATADEQRFLQALITGQVRQGALDGVLQAGIAAAAEVPETQVRRAVMLAGSASAVARVAAESGLAGLLAVGLQVGRGVRPMLAASAPDLASAFEPAAGDALAVERKIDGVRLQIHKDGDLVRLFTRSLDDITARLPEVVELVRELPARSLVLDAEAVALSAAGRPLPFQVTGARTASRVPSTGPGVSTFVFDILHLDGADLLDSPAVERHRRLTDVVPERALIERIVTADPARAQAFFEAQLAAGHEGVVVKSLQSGYAAGRRGAGWVKVKPRHTLDLVVLAVEWGSGRRRGLLSNIHLGARDGTGGFVMLGKTFKGMTDEMLQWQTRRFLELETGREGHVVWLRPEQVVEIAIDGLQRSSRYPGGLALRFARVVRYRPDKSAGQADTMEAVRRLAPEGELP